jgi:hypothetical protein
MKIFEVKERTQELVNTLLEVWENSVKATHLFLSDNEIENKRICTTSFKRSSTFNSYRERK